MARWILFCVLLSAGAVAAVWAVAPRTPNEPSRPAAPAANNKPEPEAVEAPPAPPAAAPARATAAQLMPSQRPLPHVLEYAKVPQQTFAVPIVVPGGSLVIVEQQEVAAEKDGKIIFIGTDVQPGEVVPPEKQLPKAELGFLAIPIGTDEQLKEGEEKFQFPNSTTWYRRVRETDELKPNMVALGFESREVRKLKVGDLVKRGQLLALINPRKSFDDVAIKVAKLNAADADRLASQKQKEEFQKRHESHLRQNQIAPGTVPQEEVRAALVQRDKFAFEEKAKAAEVTRAQRELNAALTDLRMHEIRAAIDGSIKVIYKNSQGEAVKPMEPVLQIQNPGRLRVEGLLEVQEALKLKPGMKVFVEASRPEPPRLVISGHLNTVNCVAVSKGKRPVIVSGSEDETLRGWDSMTGEKLWLMSGLKSGVRSVACSPPSAKRNLVLFGCADGNVRLLDLDNLKEVPRDLAEHHQGPVNGVAFSPDGEVCATCSEDRSILLWKTESGEVLYRLPQVHRGPVTSVQFASDKRLVSAGRDNRLAVWDVEAGKPPVKVPPDFSGRGGEVSQIGVSPDGKTVLFDQGKELRLLSLADKQIEGTLQNPSDAMNFSTMALFGPDGKTILTNGPAPGKLQLWRTPAGQARASELRQFIWMKGTATCGAFAPENSFAVTGTQDHQVLVWTMPEKDEIESRLEATLTLVEKHLDTQSRQVRVWAELQNPGWLIPGTRATMVVPPQN
jgi:WD40 repeat protein